ncbi:phosphatase PAP2 family protein [Actinomyces trachealis]|uniref:phosphatase PAP2 family protein n=1 Tax=Actinomyces trachealis TaxID=2763540 RepID=UPI0018928EEA|nr:phosphatase PAP2 family protein [Actinomyces trachealis]
MALTWPALLGVLTFLGLSLGLRLPTTTSSFDQEIHRATVSWRPPTLTPLVSAVTSLGSPIGLALLTCLAAAWWAMRRGWRPAAFTLCTMLGASLLSSGLKLLFAWPRPPLANLLGTPENNYSFPSGHSLGTAAFTTTLLCLAVLEPLSARHKTVAVACCVALPVFVGLSRIYLGYHWPTDVLAGWALGIAWPCLALLVTTSWQQRQPAK